MTQGPSGQQGLVVNRLVKRYGAVTAVSDVSFTVGPGEFISLLGPSGCGKTTTLRCIAGFEHPQEGSILVDGKAVTDPAAGIFTPPNRRQFGMVFQSYAIWPHMTVFNNVGYPLKVQRKYPRTEIRERVNEKLKVVGLANYEDRYPSQLSGGQQQRVALARALVMEPRVLLFDEPLSNLDAKLRERMRFELIEIQKQLGIPAVYVTHDQAEAMVMSDRIIVMDGGRVAQEGSPDEVYGRPASRFVADFIGLSNFLPARVESAADDGALIVTSALGRHASAGNGTHSQGDEVLIAIRPERIELGPATGSPGYSFETEVQRRYFLGPCTEYFLVVGDAVIRAQSSTIPDAAVGTKITARVLPEHFQVVANEPSGRAHAEHDT
jgi:iron(III) transport system ATP-binding protein